MADLRKCIGSAKFGIEAHDAPAADFPVQPSQKGGLGRMCRTHWTQYTTALRTAALARKAAEAEVASDVAPTGSKPAASPIRRTAERPTPEPIRTRPARGRKTEGEQIVEAVDAAIAREAAKEASIA